MDYVYYFLMGSCAGLMSGLFGISGGILVVSGLALLFAHLHLASAYIMHMAAGTSLAVMIITTASSSFSHFRLGTIQWPLVKLFLPGILLGVVGGAIVADYLPTYMLRLFLAVFLLLSSASMMWKTFRQVSVARIFPSNAFVSFFALLTGALSGMLGIGTGSLSVPFLSRYHVPMKNAAGVAATCTLPVAILGTIMFVMTGWDADVSLAHTTGYVYWPAFFAISAASFIFAPLGAKLSTGWPTVRLKRILSVVLLIVACGMLYQG